MIDKGIGRKKRAKKGEGKAKMVGKSWKGARVLQSSICGPQAASITVTRGKLISLGSLEEVMRADAAP